jgi:hypothetical protein
MGLSLVHTVRMFDSERIESREWVETSMVENKRRIAELLEGELVEFEVVCTVNDGG